MAILGKSGQRKNIFLFLGASLVISGKRGTIKYPLPVRASHVDNMESMLFFFLARFQVHFHKKTEVTILTKVVKKKGLSM